MVVWKDTAKDGLAAIVDSLRDDFSDVLHLRMRVDEGHVEVLKIDQRLEALATLERLTGARIAEHVPGQPLYQVVVIAPDGTEEITRHCLTMELAEAYVESFNHVGPRDSHVAEMRPYLTSFARDTHGKLHALLCV